MAMDAKKKHEKVAVYLETGIDEYVFIKDTFVYIEHNKKFSADAPPGLWLTCASGIVRTRYGVLGIYDDRIKKWKPSPIGWASPDDGDNLMNAMRRECSEEIVVFSLDRKLQFVPSGVTASLSAPSLGIPRIEAVTTVGSFEPKRFFRKGRVLVLHAEWDLREMPENTTIVSDDEWWQGGFFGAPVVAFANNGSMTGYYSGQQGFVDLRTCVIDEDLTEILNGLT